MNFDPMTMALTTAGIGLVVKIVWDWLKEGKAKKNGTDDKTCERIAQILDDVKYIRSLSEVRDNDAIPMIFFPRQAVKTLSDNETKIIETLTLLSRELERGIKNIENYHDHSEKRIKDMIDRVLQNATENNVLLHRIGKVVDECSKHR